MARQINIADNKGRNAEVIFKGHIKSYEHTNNI